MKTYLVTWATEIDAETPQDAAKQALDMHRDPESIATCFNVYDTEAPDYEEGVEVDFLENEEDTENNTPCIVCGSQDVPLHVSGRCGNCGPGLTNS